MAFDLLSPVLARRTAALSLASWAATGGRLSADTMNATWAEAGTPVPPERDPATAMADTQAAFDAARGGTLFGPVDLFLTQSNPATSYRYEQAGRFAVPYLQ